MKNTLNDVIEVLTVEYQKHLLQEDFIPLKSRELGLTPLEQLIGIILSQNTTDRNAFNALTNLIKHMSGRVTLSKLRDINVVELASVIRKAGMQMLKARTIKKLAEVLNSEEELMVLDVSELVKKLRGVKGIGPKTIDVFLANVRNIPIFPIDTHIRRVLYRLGYIRSKNEEYEVIRDKVVKDLPPEKLLTAHYILILHGRKTCKARKPLCNSCVVNNLCDKVGVVN
ncbi:MAG: hypothetical protein B7O98_03300 [Zestosphaera tikiterensis]|uniref:HhH-GPD domain-containing protein n=1 Tax=Zestosphaera tikiterensis TaxID=1973259 RepID=A0A2R7Y7E4_9CREN|nr:MAG: hypothetical protein B7O98_03300 [Zestosphaera tikiterensis]